ncbi:MAG: GTPase HflX [Bacilli bacterium]
MEKAIIIGVNTISESHIFLDEIEELKNLCLACDIEVIDVITQNLNDINSSTYVGKGKIEEIKIAINSLDAETLVFNDELTPSQINNLQEALEIAIYDRTFIILEIFKRRAKTKEALMQVEIATLKYSLPRLTGLRQGLSRQRGAGGGFAHGRGAGETKLELDRRITNDRIVALKKELEAATILRKQQRKTRKTNNMHTVCLVGYTNSGKSSTLNALLNHSKGIKKEVFQKDMLFATLETSTRAIQTETNFRFLVTDTVGFVNKLPHHLVEAFKSTLEEITEADLIVHVVDATNSNYKLQIETTEQVLQSIGVLNIPTIYAFNKIDLLDEYLYIQPQYIKAIRISATTDKNIDKLIEMIQKELERDFIEITLSIPYKEQEIIEFLKDNGYVKAINYLETRIEVLGKLPQRLLSKVEKYK